MAMPVTGLPGPDPQDPRSSRSPRAGELGAAEARRRWRRRRRRQWMMGFMAGLTVLVLLVIAGFVKEISRMPAQAQAAALTATTRSAAHASSPRPSPKRPDPKPSPSARAAIGPQITDASSGLSYQLLSRPWQRGCLGLLDTPMFSWTAGEHAVAGPADAGGTVIEWHGNACSGQLNQDFAYSGPADLEPVAMGVADATDPAFYAGLSHSRTLQDSSAIQVSGHPAWVVRFLMTYPDAAAEGLAWTSEAAAVVVVDRGPARAPAVFYSSVPSNLGTGTVATLINSLRLT
jgi:hypothetical protein